MKILLYDNYDSFTYNLLDYLGQCGARCTVIRNDEKTTEEILEMQADGIVLSPGPGRPSASGGLMDLLQYIPEHLPVLGICLGHQALGEHYGAKLVKAARPMHGKTSAVLHTGHAMYEQIPTRFEVMRYHSLALEELPAELEATAVSDDGTLMSLAHKKLPRWGVQYHPESILSEYGLTLIHNWLNRSRSGRR